MTAPAFGPVRRVLRIGGRSGSGVADTRQAPGHTAGSLRSGSGGPGTAPSAQGSLWFLSTPYMKVAGPPIL
jgi:hypothetical protein